MLTLCSNCQRHIKAQSENCPFCAAASTTAKEPGGGGRVSRAMMFAGASALAGAACFSAQPAYGTCFVPTEVTLDSPCGFVSVSTTCAGTTKTCGPTTCTIGPMTASCSIDVTLGDGTQHTVPVTVGTVSPGGFCGNQSFTAVTSDPNPSFASPTCVTPPPDAGSDASDDASPDAPAD